MAVESRSRIRWGTVAAWGAFPLVAVVEFRYLRILPDTVTWEAAVGALVIAALTAVPLILGRLRAGRWASACLALVLVIDLPLSFIQGLKTCRECGTHRRHAELGWGIGAPWVRLPLGTSTRPTHALADFFPAGHEHVWNFNWEHQDGAFLLNTLVSGGYRSCGSGHVNVLGMRYEKDGSFRESLKGRIQSGEVSEDQVRLLLALSMGFHRHASVPPGTHALVKQAGGWMGEYFWDPRSEKDWPPETKDGR